MTKEKRGGKEAKQQVYGVADCGRYPHQDRVMQEAHRECMSQIQRPIGCASVLAPDIRGAVCHSFAPPQMIGHIYMSAEVMQLNLEPSGKYQCVGGARRCTGHKLKPGGCV